MTLNTPTIFGSIRSFLSGYSSSPTSSGPGAEPYLLKQRSSTVFIVFTVCIAIFTDILYYGLIVPVIPFSLHIQVGIPEDQVQQWTAILLACYNVTLFIGSPIAGLYADHTASRRLPLLFGLLALLGSTFLLCFGTNMTLLILGRLLQGLSAAIVWSVGLALLVDTIGKDIGYAMGWVSIAMSVGLLISPVIGGAVYAAAGYYAVYFVAFAVVAVDIVLRMVLIEKKVARQWLPEDSSSTPVVSTGVTRDVSESRTEKSDGGDTHASAADPTTGADRVAAGRPTAGQQEEGVGSGADVPESSPARAAAETALAPTPATHPYLELLKSRRTLAALLGVIIEAGVMFAFDTVVPLFVKNTFHWSSTAAGLVFICVMVPGFASPLVGMLSDKYGAKWPSVVGFAATVPLLVCLRFVTDNTLQHKVLLCALLALMGLTLLTLANTPLMAEITYSINAKEAERPGMWGAKGVYGIAYGLYATAFALGGTIGSIMAGYLVAGPGWGTATWSLALWCAFGVVVSCGLGGRPPKKIDNTTCFDASPTATEGDSRVIGGTSSVSEVV
ncbi:major facilitator superfamily domain-containing protein [Diplogelasinospora grovesii]|uniref:Major facilitator superfamily domain-containing protein n=1 Tax=Diplogelasinospora grovesii TaxID=303347 RepID=A0AAN6NGY8_9PEZI|nr:major facilitator superfamily domain-containing protein [Diplogelasinospora grovesii]